MGKRKYLLIIFISVFSLTFVSLLGFYSKNPEISNCIIVSLSDEFEIINGNLYLSKDTPEGLKDSVIKVLKKADKRACEYWNIEKQSENPKIIFCYSHDTFEKYSKSKTIISYKTPLGFYIVFGEGFIDLDMLSHEICHSELFSRIGFINSIREIPTWFDEGVAMQVDYREEYSEEKYNEIKESKPHKINFENIRTVETFWSGEYYYNYIESRHEVKKWIKEVGEKGLEKLIERIREGEQFDEVYRQMREECMNGN
jgi:hypothetical protein